MIDIQALKEEFFHHFGKGEVETYFSPGRVNLIGEHIDYNGGFVLPAAISLGISAVVRKNNTRIIRVFSQNFKEHVEIHFEDDFDFEGSMHWSKYITAMLQVLIDNNFPLSGADIMIDSDLPLGSGLSSSASLECLIAYIFNREFYEDDRRQMALHAQCAERTYVGVNCGIMDQYAVANGKANHAMLLNCAAVDSDYIPVDFKNYQLLIINSNKPRALADSKYNERRAECDKALQLLRKIDPADDLCSMHEISLGYLEDDTLYKRAKHAVLENKRVLHATEALKRGELEAFGQLLVESHVSLDENYEVSCIELNTIVHYSMHFEGCIGARMTGAGFGGCCIALVEKMRVQKFISYVAKKYEEKTNLKAAFYDVAIADGVKKF